MDFSYWAVGMISESSRNCPGWRFSTYKVENEVTSFSEKQFDSFEGIRKLRGHLRRLRRQEFRL